MSTRYATFETTRGTLTAELFDRDCPETVETFERLANAGFYDGASLAPAPGALVQATVNAIAGSEAPLSIETIGNRNRPAAGALVMGRAGERGDTTRLLFVTDEEGGRLLEGTNTVFGMTEDGLDVLRLLQAGDRLRAVRVRA
jgi:peptidyl-prolyl cis-trans isomerase B (cyclophilin B)